MDRNDTKNSSPRYEADDLQKAVAVMQRGGIILYPTDTVWGIGCDATNPKAVEKIFRLKQRAEAKSMLVLVESEAALERTVANVPDVAWQLIEVAVHPVTIIYDKGIGVAPALLAEDGSLGVRITREPFSAALCRRLHKPVVSTSANVSGQPAPALFRQIAPEIIEGVDYVVRFRRNDNTAPSPSNIIKLSDSGVVKVIR
ncbi:MAG: threonylcarbamoyl-AMP synthase [Muribaculaceae bacterium]|nr:threonylcarbamoyl-AMP synthase [Muribaculaceae bacterium]